LDQKDRKFSAPLKRSEQISRRHKHGNDNEGRRRRDRVN
jgi:hypothetical protein